MNADELMAMSDDDFAAAIAAAEDQAAAATKQLSDLKSAQYARDQIAKERAHLEELGGGIDKAAVQALAVSGAAIRNQGGALGVVERNTA